VRARIEEGRDGEWKRVIMSFVSPMRNMLEIQGLLAPGDFMADRRRVGCILMGEDEVIVLFGLASGSRDSPPLTPFTADNYASEMTSVAAEFLQEQVDVRVASNELYLPTCIQPKRSSELIIWRDNKDLIDKIWPLLKDTQRGDLKTMLERGKVDIKWKINNWVPYYIREQNEAFLEVGC